MKAVPATFSATIDRAKPSAATPTTLTIDAGAQSSRGATCYISPHIHGRQRQDQGKQRQTFHAKETQLLQCNDVSFLTTLIQISSSDIIVRRS